MRGYARVSTDDQDLSLQVDALDLLQFPHAQRTRQGFRSSNWHSCHYTNAFWGLHLPQILFPAHRHRRNRSQATLGKTLIPCRTGAAHGRGLLLLPLSTEVRKKLHRLRALVGMSSGVYFDLTDLHAISADLDHADLATFDDERTV